VKFSWSAVAAWGRDALVLLGLPILLSWPAMVARRRRRREACRFCLEGRDTALSAGVAAALVCLPAFFSALQWWRDEKWRMDELDLCSSAPAYRVLRSFVVEAHSCGTRVAPRRQRDLWPAWRPICYLQDGGHPLLRLLELNASSPTSGSSPEEERWLADAKLRRKRAN
jgi:hypothetical protein